MLTVQRQQPAIRRKQPDTRQPAFAGKAGVPAAEQAEERSRRQPAASGARTEAFPRPWLGSVRFGMKLSESVFLNNLEGSPYRDNAELKQLNELRARLVETAKAAGLDGYPVFFHVLPEDKFFQVAARNGFSPEERYKHWSWGQEYFTNLKLPSLYGIREFREVVVNNNPVTAYLSDRDPGYVKKIMMIHALARSDFYKNNIYFRHSSHRLKEMFANHAGRMRAYAEDPAIGADKVEQFVDKVHTIRNLIDTNLLRKLDTGRRPEEQAPVRDILGYIAHHTKHLEPWQRDIIYMIREETRALVPQQRTRIVSDGWAAFWNRKLNQERPDFWDLKNFSQESKFMAEIFKLDPVKINTYKVGAILFRHIEDQLKREYADHPERDRKVLEGLLKVRREENDLTILRKYLTPRAAQELLLYTYGVQTGKKDSDPQKPGTPLFISSREHEQILTQLLRMYENVGEPVIEIVDTDYHGEGALLLRHLHEYDLKRDYSEKTLMNLAQVWGTHVYLETKQTDGEGNVKPVLLWSNGESFAWQEGEKKEEGKKE